MRPSIDREIIQRVDPRTLSPHRGYIQSILAPVQIRHDGIPVASVYGTIVFDALLIGALTDSIVRHLTSSRSVLDIVRYANPWQTGDDHWRHAKSLKDLLQDEVFAEHIHERLIEFERLRGRPNSALDATGHPSLALLSVVLSTLEKLEEIHGLEWARLGLESWPNESKIPKGYQISDSRPPHSGRDMFAYLHRVYDIEFAGDILPEVHVRSFAYTLFTRAVDRKMDVGDLLDSTGQPTLSTLSACAEAMARGIVKISQVLPFVKRRIAERRTNLIAASSLDMPSGLLKAVHAEYVKILNFDREFTPFELKEIALQSSIHSDDPALIAKIVCAVVSPLVNEDEGGVVRHGSLVLSKAAARSEGIAV